jgi:hypothetical protein
MKAYKNNNNVVGEEQLAHIRTIVVFFGGQFTSGFLYATMDLLLQRYDVIFRVLILFCCS